MMLLANSSAEISPVQFLTDQAHANATKLSRFSQLVHARERVSRLNSRPGVGEFTYGANLLPPLSWGGEN